MAIVTGASSGLGIELARCFAAGGYDLLLTARRTDELHRLANELAGVTVHVMPADLTDADAPRDLIARMTAQKLVPDVLVANAGFGLYGPFAENDEQRLRDLLQVNILAVTSLIRLVLPGMIERRRGRILTVASTAAFQPGPLMAAYYASKAFVLSLSEALAHECRGKGVTVTCLCPGPIATGFAAAASVGRTRIVDGPGVMDARTVAESGYRACIAGKRVAVPGMQNRLGAMCGRHLPRWLILPLVRRLQARKEG